MKRLACLGILLGLIVPVLALAAKTPVEASMVLTGTITVNPDGSVRGYALHDADKVPPGVVQLVKRTLQGWRFFPIVEHGKPVTARAGMTVRVTADMVDAKHVAIKVSGAQFGCSAYQADALLPGACKPATIVQPLQRKLPLYPLDAAHLGAEGVVYLVVEVGRDGHVMHAAARQVNLYHRLQTDQAAMRESLAQAAQRAALKWTFKVPTVGPEAAMDHWIVQVPVDYRLEPWHGWRKNGAMCESTMTCKFGFDQKYGQWQGYVRGPVRVIPWADGDSKPGAHANGDAIAGNGALFIRDGRFVLKTPLAGNGSQS